MSTARLGGPKAIPLNFAEAEEAAATPDVRRVLRTAMLLLFVGFGGLLGWAAITPIESAVVATGTLVAEGRRKSIILSEPGILQHLLVREGERVRAGQLLVRLDPTTAEAAAAQARTAWRTLQTRAARLRAEQQGERHFAIPPEVQEAARNDAGIAAIVASERRLFDARWEAFDGNIGVFERRAAVVREQLQAAGAQRSAAARRLASIRADLSGMRPLAAQGYARMREIREMDRLESQLVGDLGSFGAQEAQFRQSIAQLELELSAFRLQRAQEVARELQDTQQLLAEVEQRVRAAENVRARRDLVAPEAGIVTDIRFVTPGSSIADGQPVLDLLPVDDRLVLEMKVAPTDVEQLNIGKRLNVRLLALRVRTTPLLSGRLTYVSADQQLDQHGNAYFLARGEIDPGQEGRIPGGATLVAGMPIEVFVLGETRSALNYLVAPITNSMRRALRD